MLATSTLRSTYSNDGSQRVGNHRFEPLSYGQQEEASVGSWDGGAGSEPLGEETSSSADYTSLLLLASSSLLKESQSAEDSSNLACYTSHLDQHNHLTQVTNFDNSFLRAKKEGQRGELQQLTAPRPKLAVDDQQYQPQKQQQAALPQALGLTRQYRPGDIGRKIKFLDFVMDMEELYGTELTKCSREVLLEMVARQKDELIEQETKTTLITEQLDQLSNQNQVLERELQTAKGRTDELLTEEERMEEELAGRIEVLDKLRTTVRELERERRDASKRYREQSDSFDSERQSWYDQEKHYKVRISNLANVSTTTGGRKGRLSDLHKPAPKKEDAGSDNESDQGSNSSPFSHRGASSSGETSATSISFRPTGTQKGTVAAPSSPSTSPSPTRFLTSSQSTSGPTAKEIALEDQLGSLTTAHSSLTNTLRALQVEMSDLKRVYQDLQEENESYEALLGEKTLNGTVLGGNLFRRSSQWCENNDDEFIASSTKPTKSRGGDQSLDSDDDLKDEKEEEETDDEEDVEKILLETQGSGSPSEGAVSAVTGRGRRSRKPAVKPRPSGGLDLAAELEAAQTDASTPEKPKKKKKDASKSLPGESLEELRSEVKALREANKALTLYVSKIVDRVCSQEGFEKVLAVDFRNTPKLQEDEAPLPEAPLPDAPLPDVPTEPESTINFRARPNGLRSPSGNGPTVPPLNTASGSLSDMISPPVTPMVGGVSYAQNHRKGISMGWDSVQSAFASALSRTNALSTTAVPPNPPPSATLKPFRLSMEIKARKLSIEEDEEDIRERERLRAEMALHGIEEPGNSWGTRPVPDQRRKSSTTSVRSMSSTSTGQHTLPPLPASPNLKVPGEQVGVPTEAAGKDSRRTPTPELRIRSPKFNVSGEPLPEVGLGIYDKGPASASISPLSSPSIPIDGQSVPSSAAVPKPETGSQQDTESWSKKLKRVSVAWSSPQLG